MNRLLCALALAGFACGASAHLAEAGNPARSFSEQDAPVVALLSSNPDGARSFSELLAAAAGDTSQTAPRLKATSAVPEPQTYALLLAGLGAIVFIAIRRRRP